MKNLLDRENVKKVNTFIKRYNPSLKVIFLKNKAKTAKNAAKALDCDLGAIVKSLLFRTDNSFTLCLVAGDKRCSLNKLKKLTNKKNISMASPQEVKTQTGYTIGGVSPVGHLKILEILIDNSLKRFNDLYASAGHPNYVFKIDFDNLQKITNGEIKELTE
jgi:Cys-tRNA(Pro) deacylase